MGEKKRELKEACFIVAKATMWGRKPIDMDVIHSHANKLFEEALFQYNLVAELGGSISLVIRAVHYLGQVHAIPPMKDDIDWFSDSLRILLEIAVPNSDVQGQAREFLLDMQGGISSFIVE